VRSRSSSPIPDAGCPCTPELHHSLSIDRRVLSHPCILHLNLHVLVWLYDLSVDLFVRACATRLFPLISVSSCSGCRVILHSLSTEVTRKELGPTSVSGRATGPHQPHPWSRLGLAHTGPGARPDASLRLTQLDFSGRNHEKAQKHPHQRAYSPCAVRTEHSGTTPESALLSLATRLPVATSTVSISHLL